MIQNHAGAHSTIFQLSKSHKTLIINSSTTIDFKVFVFTKTRGLHGFFFRVIKPCRYAHL